MSCPVGVGGVASNVWIIKGFGTYHAQADLPIRPKSHKFPGYSSRKAHRSAVGPFSPPSTTADKLAAMHRRILVTRETASRSFPPDLRLSEPTMKRPRRKNPVAAALWANAILLAGILLVLVGRSNSASLLPSALRPMNKAASRWPPSRSPVGRGSFSCPRSSRSISGAATSWMSIARPSVRINIYRRSISFDWLPREISHRPAAQKFQHRQQSRRDDAQRSAENLWRRNRKTNASSKAPKSRRPPRRRPSRNNSEERAENQRRQAS